MSDDLDSQLTLTSELVAQRLAMGDRAEVPRQVDHLAFFKRSRADAAIGELEAAGFTVRDATRRLLKVGVEFHRTDACDHESAAAFTREVVSIVAKHGGSYDGWASFITQGTDAG